MPTYTANEDGPAEEFPDIAPDRPAESELRQQLLADIIQEERVLNVERQLEELRRALTTTRLERDAMIQAFEIERNDLKTEIATLLREKNEAKERAVYHTNKSQEAAKTLQLIKTEHASIADGLRDTISKLRGENAELAAKIQETQQEQEMQKSMYRIKEIELQSNVDDLQRRIEIAEEQNQYQEQLIAEGQQREKQLLEKVNSLQKQLTQVNAAAYDARITAELDEQLKLQSAQLRDLELANGKLSKELDLYKKRYPNIEALAEEKHRLEREVRDLRQVSDKAKQLESENAKLKAEKLEWAQYFESDEAKEFVTPQDLLFNFSRARTALRAAEINLETMNDELKKRDEIEQELNENIEILKARVKGLEKQGKLDEAEKTALNRQKEMIAMHRDMLEEQLLNLCKLEEASSTNQEDSTQLPMTKRIEQLESLIKQYQETLAAQEVSKEAEISREESDNERILELKDNPYSKEQAVRKEQLTRLRQENAELLKQIEDMRESVLTTPFEKKRKRSMYEDQATSEDNDDDDSDESNDRVTIPKITLHNLHGQIDELKQVVAQRDKRILRLNQVFERRFEELGDAIQKLLGYRIELESGQIVRLWSVYVDEAKLCFVFNLDEEEENDATVRILGTEREQFRERLEGSYESFITQRQSIPGFLSSVTLDLLEPHSEEYQDGDQAYEIPEDEQGYEDEEYDQEQYNGVYEDEQGQEGEEEEEGEDAYYDDEDDYERPPAFDQSNTAGNNSDDPICLDDD